MLRCSISREISASQRESHKSLELFGGLKLHVRPWVAWQVLALEVRERVDFADRLTGRHAGFSFRYIVERDGSLSRMPLAASRPVMSGVDATVVRRTAAKRIPQKRKGRVPKYPPQDFAPNGRRGRKPLPRRHVGVGKPVKATYFAASDAFLTEDVMSSDAFLAAAVMSSEMSLPADIISSTVSI